MFDVNQFKRSMKDWISSHPEGTIAEFTDYCDDMIPPPHYAANQWLIDQSISWFRYLKAQNQGDGGRSGDGDDTDEG